MARQKGNVGLGKNGKRGRPRKVVAVADGNGVERNTEAFQKAAKTIIKVKGKRGRPVGSTKKGKKRGRPPKARNDRIFDLRANKNAKSDNEHKHDLSDNNVENRADMETHQHNVDEREVGDDEDDNERSAESD